MVVSRSFFDPCGNKPLSDHVFEEVEIRTTLCFSNAEMMRDVLHAAPEGSFPRRLAAVLGSKDDTVTEPAFRDPGIHLLHMLNRDVPNPFVAVAQDVPPFAVDALEFARVQGGKIFGRRLDDGGCRRSQAGCVQGG